MAGKRIAREKKTISSMIALYQRRCPEARDDTEHYQALNAYADKRLDRCVFGEEKPACKQCPGALLSARETRRDEADYALGGAEDALAASDPDDSPPDR